MGWLYDAAIDLVADVFGYQLGKGRPWWIEWLASLGCLFVIGVPIAVIWVLLR